MSVFGWVVEQVRTLATGVQIVRKMAERRRADDRWLREFEIRRSEKVKQDLQLVAQAYARKEGLPIDSVTAMLNKEGAIVATVRVGGMEELRVLGFIDEARPN